MDSTEDLSSSYYTKIDENIPNSDVKQGPNPFGYDLFPERQGDRYKPSVSDTLQGKGRENIERAQCEKRIWNVTQKNPAVKLMLSALSSADCTFDLSRHVACEVCDMTVTGGYDIKNNQIVICQNMCKYEAMVGGVLTHEMLHMFDHCKHKLDFKNIDHVACTEIRAANLTHCSFISSSFMGDSSLINISKTHQNCVKTKAAYSVKAVHNISIEEAMASVEKVFPKCYADLEPIGRRVRTNSQEMDMAYRDRHRYGY